MKLNTNDPQQQYQVQSEFTIMFNIQLSDYEYPSITLVKCLKLIEDANEKISNFNERVFWSSNFSRT